MVAGFLQNLRLTDQMVNPDTGTPTLAFLRLLGITTGAAEGVTNNIIAGSGLSGGGSLDAGPVTLDAVATSILDQISSARGSVLYRGAAAWLALAPGASGRVLRTNGAGADPTWEGISVLLDLIGSTQGMVLYRSASGWAALSPGTAGQVLTTGGAGADPSWAAGGGGGGVSPSWITAPTPPVSASFTLFKDAGTTATLTDKSRGVLLSITGAGATDKVALIEKTTPGSTWVLTTLLQPNFMLRRYSSFGVYVRDNTAGRIECFHIAQSDSGAVVVPLFRDSKFNSITSYNSDNAGTKGMRPLGSPLWMRLTLNATNLVVGMSLDGETFENFYQVAKNNWVATIDRCGIVMAVNNTDDGISGEVSATLMMSHSLV